MTALTVVLGRPAQDYSQPKPCVNPACRKLRRKRAGQQGWEGCHGLCGACYFRWRKAGCPETGVPPRRSRSQCAQAINARRREEAAVRHREYAEMRDLGWSQTRCSWELGVGLRTIQRYEKTYREQQQEARAA